MAMRPDNSGVTKSREIPGDLANKFKQVDSLAFVGRHLRYEKAGSTLREEPGH